MITSSNGNIFRVTSHLCGEFPGPQTPMTHSFDVFFDRSGISHRRLTAAEYEKDDIDMMASPNVNIFRVTAHWAGNSPVTGEFPAQRPVTRSFDVCFDLRLNKRLSKRWWGWWFETPSHPLWCHCNSDNLHRGPTREYHDCCGLCL